jgi:hypothetical protein
MKNKGKEKVVKDFIDNKLLCKAMVLWYIHVSVRGESQSFFTKRWREDYQGAWKLNLASY